MELKNNLGDTIYLDSRYDINKIKFLIENDKHSEIDNYLSTIKGYPSHAQGGVDIKLGKDGFSFTKGSSQIMATHGLVLPAMANYAEDA